MATVKQIFDSIQMLNPSQSISSSLGSYTSSNSINVAESLEKEVAKFLPKDSIAFEILTTARRYSEKQLWVIAYALKDTDYAVSVDEADEYYATEKEVKRARRARKATTVAPVAPVVEVTPVVEVEDVAPVAPVVEVTPVVEVEVAAVEVADPNVIHPTFGRGRIVTENPAKITVLFADGERSFLRKFANLKPIK